MTYIVRNSALALAMLGGVALASAPALADSHNQRHGHHGKSWNGHAQNDWRRNNRFHNGYAYDGYAYRNPYAYYGPRPYYGYGNYYNYGRPGFSIYIR